MDDRKLTVIENKTKINEKIEKKQEPKRQSNPIAKKLVEFHHENIGKFSVKDLFKK